MIKRGLAIIFCFVFLIGSFGFTSAATKVLDYGFESWNGSEANTKDYIFSASTSSYRDEYVADSEVVTSYTPLGKPTWMPHSGNYFLVRCDSPGYLPNPSIPGITQGNVDDHHNIGYRGSYGGGNNFKFTTNVTTGKLFISFWAILYGWDNIPASGYSKWMRVESTNDAPSVYMHINPDHKPGYQLMMWINGNFRKTINMETLGIYLDDGNWHKYSMYIDYVNKSVYQWVDVENETLTNYVQAVISPSYWTDQPVAPYYLNIQANFCGETPTGIVLHALDDIEIWDGIPTSTPTTCTTGQTRTCTTGQSGICSAGTQTCSNNIWGTCTRTNNPTTETCGNTIDEDCNGADLPCVCNQIHAIDKNPCNGRIDVLTELVPYIDSWLKNEQGVSINQLIEAIIVWKS